MVKTLIRASLLAALLMLTVSFVTAQEATPLEGYLPADTEVYLSIRTDDGYIETLDAVYANVLDKVSVTSLGMFVPPEMSQMSLATILEMGSQQFFATDFQTAVRSWLGQRVVVGVSDLGVMMDADSANDNDLQLIVAVEITDAAEARAFVEKILTLGGMAAIFEESTDGDFTVLTASMPSIPSIFWNDSVLIIGLNAGVADVTSGESLVDAPEFDATLSQLPAESYNIVVYQNLTGVIDAALAAVPMPDETTAGLLNTLASGFGQQALGLTLLDGRTFVIDSVQDLGDLSGLEEMGLPSDIVSTLMGAYSSVDAGYATVLPAQTEYLIHGSNLRAVYDGLIGYAASLEGVMPMEEGESVEDMIAELEAQFNEATGLSLEENVLSWLGGDYAAVLWLSAEATEPSAFSQYYYALEGIDIPLGVEGGVVVETTNPEGSRGVLDALSTTLMDLMAESEDQATLEETTIGSADALVLSVSSPVGTAYDELVEAGTFTPSNQIVELVFATNDNLVVVGTMGLAESVFLEGGGLGSAAHYMSNSAYFLENSASVYYISGAGFGTLFDFAAVGGQQVGEVFEEIIASLEGNVTPEPDLDALAAQLEEDRTVRQSELVQLSMVAGLAAEGASLFGGTSISVALSGEDTVVLRAVISLSE